MNLFDGKEGWEFSRDKLVRINSSKRVMLDGFLSYQGEPFAVIEFKSVIRNDDFHPISKYRGRLLVQMYGVGSQCAIFCTPELIYLWFEDEDTAPISNWQSGNVYDIILSFWEKLASQRTPLDIDDIKKTWKDILDSTDDIPHKEKNRRFHR